MESHIINPAQHNNIPTFARLKETNMPLKGWKTMIGGGIAFALGGYMLYVKQYEQGLTLVSLGFTAWGLGHKLDRANSVLGK